MKQLEITVLKSDADAVLECLGRRGVMQFASTTEEHGREGPDEAAAAAGEIRRDLELIKGHLSFLGLEIPSEPYESSRLPGEADKKSLEALSARIAALSKREEALAGEKRGTSESLEEVRSFANLNAPFSSLDQLSYLTLRIGKLDPPGQDAVKQALGGRAALIPLGQGRVVAAASRKGRFALDSELKKGNFVPIAVPPDFRGVPPELLSGLEKREGELDRDLVLVAEEKNTLRETYGGELRRLCASYLMASITEDIKSGLPASRSVYILSGWVPADKVKALTGEILAVSGGRAAVYAYDPDELKAVREGKEKVPVSLSHGAFVRGFEPLVFSYGAPLYGTIDPTPVVAFFYTLLFGIMFGDLGQGFVLLVLGLLIGRVQSLKKFRVYATPLIAVGAASMVMGFLYGEVFAQEGLLALPSRAITGFLFGREQEVIIRLMPEKGSLNQLFMFFGFTVSVGVLLNSIGLVINIINKFSLRRYSEAFFSKTGLAGLAFFWYALFAALRLAAFGGRFSWFDALGLGLPVALIAFGPLLSGLFPGGKPPEEGLPVFFIEGVVEILEAVSSYLSNTVSFLRVGAFALSHAVLSFIIFTLSGMVVRTPGGPLWSFIIVIFGNLVIIILEGMIVAIQVVRLQYYEFFSKFFTETGVPYRPFAFRKDKGVC
jgi:V/A-type H+-transporting ATPase subunit I